ncbi:MAG: hypothetical protein M1812_004373 [Candelaria pacifica]|nr:MAG: hypothetical protein M1812_004373 [Candelaria pacifica]
MREANSFGAQLCSFVPGSSGYGDPSVNRTNYTAASVFDTVLCSQIPATQALLNSTCKPDDYSCICNSASFSNVEAIGQGERNDCNPFDYLLYQVLIVQTFQACKNVGVIIPLSNQTRATSIVANGTVNGSVGTTTGAPPPSQFTGTATALSLSWEVASVIAAVGIAALLL